MTAGALIFREIDWRAPLDAFAPLAGEPWAALLHGGARARETGWSILVAFPARRLEARGGAAFLDGERIDAAPFAALRALADARRLEAAPAPLADAPFASGLVGFIGYEMGGELEPTAAGPASPFTLPDMAFGAYDAAAVFDRKARRCFVAGRRASAVERLAGALGRAPTPARPPPAIRLLASNFSADAYERAIAGVIERIRDGALFQANLARRLRAEADAPLDAFAVFQRLAEGDAPFAAILQHGDGTIVSNSPERFFSLRRERGGWRARAEPIKGTRPRGRDPAEDDALARALLASAKDRAENVMIADLARNDLSRVCRDGSIREEAVCALVSHESVHHLVSRVSGLLRPGLGAVDAVEALFPCGSITGAPKVEAMKTIAAVEGVGRGPYCGAIGYIDDRGGADFSVAIRTMIVEGATATFPVGGGITLRSDPQAEYHETETKARGLLAALGLSGKARAA
ncbi:anthranilate synthase component I family protein [Amphiplicatus metriothermophilus]|uniref:Aminodeoxychorismate synthase, subunit I n=1 Tax=Amphiplicatus metriothermophilus TaxID=1519374 RepID=A0A239PM40_9PROT|nr:anthranilate synthase component I family protein [Amphiplicatus metriothermophilus]MBB5517235.1 para-aminobenzoate synthetase component 1 [Amphiplicatus metriothermophilus]SNT68429.1 aminodeoxychorismate synthase, subunit I [Amphiplicatus metriothermophilus]